MQRTIELLSRELNLPKEVIEKTYRAYWKFIRTKIEELPLKASMEEEEFSTLKTNFNIPNLGKLACSYKRYAGIHKKSNLIKEKKHEYKAD